jgi:methionyl-tRNA formyltransferase
MVVVAYGMLLPPSILELPRLGCINVHASILPHWRGAAPIQRSIEAGDAETGVSIMRMEAGLDTGPVFKVLTTPISEDDTSASMHNKLAELGAQGLSAVLEELSSNPQLQPEPQAHDQASYARKITKAESEVNWNASASAIQRKLRAFIPWPVCQTWHGKNRLRLWQASVLDHQPTASPGTVVAIEEEGIEVACGAGSLRLQKLQRDGGTALECREFLNGYSISPGDQLGRATDEQPGGNLHAPD